MVRSAANIPEVQVSESVRQSFAIQRYGRYWEVRDAAGELVCVTVYKRGAQEVVRRLCAG
jgi:hypothetical protein